LDRGKATSTLMAGISNDIIRSVTDTANVVAEARIRGRSHSEWVALLICYFLVFLGSLAFDKLTGADKILDALLGSEPSTDSWATTFVFGGLAVVVLLFTAIIWWALSPRVAGWFGGSRLRNDATVLFYFVFCIGTVSSLFFLPVSLVSVALQSVFPPVGSYFWLAALIAILALATHGCARAAREAQTFASYRSALLAVIVASFLTLVAVIPVLFAIVFTVEIFAPNWLEGL
jgi:hypothetical protein